MRKEVITLALALVVLLKVVSANSAPLISGLDREILVCESSNFSLEFDVIEPDGDSLTVEIFPNGPFFVRPISSQAPTIQMEIFSSNLTKLFSNKVYNHTVFVTDGELSDSKDIKITVLETNNPPSIGHIPVETVDINNSYELRKQIKVIDQESGKPKNGQFSFTISDSQNLLEMAIDNEGTINYTASESHLGVHEITICATDSGLDNLEDKIGVCAPDEIKATTCKKFQLAVVDGNSPPTILAFNSTNTLGRIAGTQKITFQVFNYDPEKIYPDTYWYVDNKLKKIGAGKSSDGFSYSFGCGVWGGHKVEAVISDGILNDSVEWTLDILNIACPKGIAPHETIGENACEEKWGCSNWGLCENVLQSRNARNLDSIGYEDIQKKCSTLGMGEDSCGYQVRTCLDVGSCNTVNEKPSELTPCHFSLEPSCSDKIQNCHDGKCEFLTDCGGPCSPCPTCSDGIENQEEEKADCGGPCLEQCGSYFPKVTKENVFIKQSMLVVIFFTLLIAAVQVFRIIRNKYKLEEQPRKEAILTHG